MANPYKVSPNQNRKTSISSLKLKTVLLYDWWLIKVATDSKGRGLGVGGFLTRERLGIRLFCSAAITKRHDNTILEARDGITINVDGFINRSRTQQNGFPSEVCNHFRFGFPDNWEEYAAQSFGEKSANRTSNKSSSNDGLDGFNNVSEDGTRNYLPTSFHDLPVNQVRDLLMSRPNDCAVTKILFDDILKNFGGDSVVDEISRNDKTTNIEAKIEETSIKREASNVIHEATSFEEKREDTKTPDKSAVQLNDPFSTPDFPEKPSEGTNTKRNASKKCKMNRTSGKERKVKKPRDESTIRRSDRVKNMKK